LTLPHVTHVCQQGHTPRLPVPPFTDFAFHVVPTTRTLQFCRRCRSIPTFGCPHACRTFALPHVDTPLRLRYTFRSFRTLPLLPVPVSPYPLRLGRYGATDVPGHIPVVVPRLPARWFHELPRCYGRDLPFRFGPPCPLNACPLRTPHDLRCRVYPQRRRFHVPSGFNTDPCRERTGQFVGRGQRCRWDPFMPPTSPVVLRFNHTAVAHCAATGLCAVPRSGPFHPIDLLPGHSTHPPRPLDTGHATFAGQQQLCAHAVPYDKHIPVTPVGRDPAARITAWTILCYPHPHVTFTLPRTLLVAPGYLVRTTFTRFVHV